MRFFTVSLGMAAAIASASALRIESRGDDQGYGRDKVSGYGDHSDDSVHAHVHIHDDDRARKDHGYGDEKNKHDDGGYGDVHKRGDNDDGYGKDHDDKSDDHIHAHIHIHDHVDDHARKGYGHGEDKHDDGHYGDLHKRGDNGGYGKGYGHGKDHHRGHNYGAKKHHDGGYGKYHKRGDDGYGSDHHRSGYGQKSGYSYGQHRDGGYGDVHRRGDDGYGHGYGKDGHRGKSYGYGPRSENLRAYSRRAGDGPGAPIPANGPVSSNTPGTLFNSTAAPPDARPGGNGSANHSGSGNLWPHCAHQCPGNVTQCRPSDWDCLCADRQWLLDNKECFQQNCDHGNEYEQVKQLFDRHCNRTITSLD
ncbi:hypothetical protein CVT26_002985 [Gymnopilus dilepis]|uniref:CFEM domain-containing protein n=1 Tax=Gymnopilus dilepis TaxID=231916 RepID=A0A409Y4K9_9AGAR|nr:hypothetical protein CVT26_002985 [Gymnopilus dilepis]